MRLPILLTTLLCPLAWSQNASELDFVSAHTDFRDIRLAWPEKVKAEAIRLLDERARTVSTIRTPAETAARRKYVREKLTAALGGFPERTPLNARVTGIVDREDYRVEKIIFESQPKFYVTANLYVPKKGAGPFPAILFPLGHETPGAKAYVAWQQLLISMAKRGYVCMAWDTIGQGERVQLFDEDMGQSKVVRSTTEHTVLGTQTLLVGDALARYTIWDGIRALDYLLSRKEVDPARVGLTGNSGGGTHTAYIAALDDRIQAAAPSCYITTWRRLLETIGPQDAEQCIPPSIADGLDHGDFIYAFAPKPYMMLVAIRDFFSITGARQTFDDARKLYTSLDASAKIGIVEVDDGHGYSQPRRQSAYQFFGRWLKGAEDNEPEGDVAIHTEEELACTPTGQVATALGGETVFTLNRQRAQQVTAGRGKPTEDAIRKAIAYERPPGAPATREFGSLARQGYRINKLMYESEPGIWIPALLYVPATASRRGVFYASGSGKASAHAEVESLVKAGATVLSADLRGFGELRRPGQQNGSDWVRYFGNYETAMTAMLIGKTAVAMRALDISKGVELLSGKAGEVYAIGSGAAGVPMLHAAAMDSRIRGVAIENALSSYDAVVNRRVNRGVFEHVVRGALKTYDLPDLAALISPRPVWIVDAVDPMGEQVRMDELRKVYSRAGAAKLVRRQPSDTAATLYSELTR